MTNSIQRIVHKMNNMDGIYIKTDHTNHININRIIIHTYIISILLFIFVLNTLINNAILFFIFVLNTLINFNIYTFLIVNITHLIITFISLHALPQFSIPLNQDNYHGYN